MRLIQRPLFIILLPATLGLACIAIGEGAGIPTKLTDRDDASADSIISVEASAPDSKQSTLTPTDPHAVFGVYPPHGSFAGGQHAIVRGAGFGSNARVWFGEVEVSEADIVRVDTQRVQVSVPPHAPGKVDIKVQNGDDTSTARIRPSAYTYDSFYSDPSTGPTSGGTDIRILGKNTNWISGAKVKVGSNSCEDLTVVSSTELKCRTAPHPAGAVSIEVESASNAESVDDAFTYSDSDNGFKGGLFGAPINGKLKVLAFHAYTGMPIPGALVIVGEDLSSGMQKKVDASGLAQFESDTLKSPQTVTVAKHCFEPVSFVDVPVDSVTVFLSPVMSPDCGADSGDIPPTGGRGSSQSVLTGQLIWKGGVEFQRAGWTNVPSPKNKDERQVAYLFTPNSDPTATFYLPESSTAVTPESEGGSGYSFSQYAYPGNITLYALAGIENRKLTPPQFTAYAFGIVRGVSATPNGTTENVFIQMDKPLNQAVQLNISPPSPGPKGPDRVIASIAVQLGYEGFAIFPNASRSIPIANQLPVQFVGLPGLDGSLEQAQFVSSASAVTGANGGAPKSIVGRRVSKDASLVVPIDGFVQVPVVEHPANGEPFDGVSIRWSSAQGGTPSDLTVIQIDAGAGLVGWTIAAPPNKTAIQLPDIGSLDMGLPRGPIDINVSRAQIEGFNYGKLQYRHLAPRGWNAYSYDVFHAYY